MKPTNQNFYEAVDTMASVIPFFPSEPGARVMIASILASFVNTVEELDWLTETACREIRDYSRSGGLPELKGIFCTRFQPADGKPVQATTTPGFTCDDLEARYREAERAENDKRFEEYKRLAKLGPAEDRKPFPLPEVKRLPEPKKPGSKPN